MRTYSDDQLRAAIAASRSWRGTLRALGLRGASAGSMRSVRRYAEQLGLDYSHFTRQRRWSDSDLTTAVANAENWTQVIDAIGLASASAATRTTLRGHALRLGLETAHLEVRPVRTRQDATLRPTLEHLHRAGSLLAAGWFELCGVRVSWPLEPARYDLIAWIKSRAERVQVKTTTHRSGSTWSAQLATNRRQMHTYGPEEIDQFFVIDGDLKYYLIPLAVVGGRKAINLSAYAEYQLARS